MWGMLDGCSASQGAHRCWAASAGSHRARCLPWQVYESGSNVDQFVTRFLLKETANQTQSLLSSVESAVDAIDEQTNPTRSAAPPARLPASRLILVQGGGGGGGGGCFCKAREDPADGVHRSRASSCLSPCLPSQLPEGSRGFPLLPCPALSLTLLQP